MAHIALHSWEGGVERLVSLELDMNCPAEKALMWLTRLSSLSSPLQLVRWQVHVEKRDNQLPSPLFIFHASSPNSVPFLIMSVVCNSSPFLSLPLIFPIHTLSGFSRYIALLFPYPYLLSVSLQHAYSQADGKRNRGNLSFRLWGIALLTSQTHQAEIYLGDQ